MWRVEAVFFVDANTGTAVGGEGGREGTILHTVDGGATWTSQRSGRGQPLFGVHFVDANMGTVVGAEGTVLRTLNGGATWTAQTTGTTGHLFGVFFADANTGWVVGGAILRTDTGGVGSARSR
jgi:photosystem II stability/assembly factor-like uncharacterized protein